MSMYLDRAFSPAKLGKLDNAGTLIASTQDFQAQSSFYEPIKGNPGVLV